MFSLVRLVCLCEAVAGVGLVSYFTVSCHRSKDCTEKVHFNISACTVTHTRDYADTRWRIAIPF